MVDAPKTDLNPKDVIEITPEMIEAGADAVSIWIPGSERPGGDSDTRAAAEDVLRAALTKVDCVKLRQRLLGIEK